MVKKQGKLINMIKFPFAIITPFISAMILNTIIIGATTSCANASHDSWQNEDDTINENELTPDLLFPEIVAKDYYQYVDFDDKAQPIISDKFIIQVIEDVVTRLSTSKGKIEFNVIKYSKTSVDICFKWTYNEKTLFKTYSFEISK